MVDVVHANHDIHSKFVEFHVGDAKITEPLIRSLYNDQGLLYQYRHGLIPVYGVLHCVLSLTRFLAKHLSLILFKPWRAIRKVYCGKQDSKNNWENTFKRVDFKQLGSQLREMLELEEAWLRIRSRFQDKGKDDNLLLVIRYALEEGVPLCCALIRGMRAGNLPAVIQIFDRMSAMYIWIPSHASYKRATLYMATNLRRWMDAGISFRRKIEEMV